MCGIFWRDHVPSVDILTRCNTFPVKSQLQSSRLRWLLSGCLMILCKKLLFGQVKGRRPQAALGLVSMMLQRVIVNCVLHD